MKYSIQNIKLYIIIFLLIFSTDSFLTFANTNTIPRNILLSSAFFCGIYGLYKRHGIVSLKKIKVLVSFCIFIGLTIIINNDYSGGNFIKMFILLLGALFSEIIDYKEIRIRYVNMMTAISIISLVAYILYPLLKNLTFLPVISNGQKSVLCLGLCNIDLSPDGILRNWGPFWEPGVFQIYLNIAIIILLLEKKRNYKKIILNIIAVITTFSTTGFIALVFIVLGFYLNDSKRITIKHILVGIFCSLGSCTLFLNETFNELLFGKFSSNNIAYASTSSRLGSIVANILCIKTNPLLGVGVKKLNDIVESYKISKGYYFFSNTNGLLMNYAIFGCIFGILYTILMLKFIFKLTGKKRLLFIFVAISIMIELFSEPLVNSLLFNTIIFYSLDKSEREINENN